MQFKFDKLKEQAEENPMLALGVGAALITSVAKLIDAAGSVSSKRAYSKRMNHSVKKHK